MAAMTPNSNLRSDLIRGVHDRASLYGNQSIGAFPSRYRSSDGTDIDGTSSDVSGIGLGR